MKLKTCFVLYLILCAGILLLKFYPLANESTIESKPISKVAIDTVPNHFEEAVSLIKEFEGWHSKKHYPYVGYGHKVLKGEKLDYLISEQEATELVRKDLRQKCSVFRSYGKDSLLLGVLAYNVGEYKLINQDGSPRSDLLKKLKTGNRDIYSEYVSYRKAWGRIIPSIEKRRIKEFQTLYIK